MDWGTFLSTFGLVFVAELGDKTQLAVLTQTCKHRRPWVIFTGASLALALVAAVSVAGGQLLGRVIPARVLRTVAALAFVVMGGLIVVDAARFRPDEAAREAACGCEEGSRALGVCWDWAAFVSTVGLLFVAELGDKTQLAVLSLAGRRASDSGAVFVGATAALVAVTALGVVGGRALCALIPKRVLLWGSAFVFLTVGALMGAGVL